MQFVDNKSKIKLKLEKLFEASGDAMLILNREGVILDCNPEFKNLLGYDKEEVLNQDIRSILKHGTSNNNGYDTLLNGKQNQIIETRVLSKSGANHHVEFTACVTKSRNKELLFCILRDISDRRLYENMILQSEERLNDIVNNTTDWIWETDEKGIYTFASGKIKEILGYELDEIIGKTPFDFIQPEHVLSYKKEFRRCYKNKLPIKMSEIPCYDKKGREIYLTTSGVPILNSQGKVKGYRGVDKDITDQRKNNLTQAAIYHISQFAHLSTDLPSLCENIHSTIQGLLDAENFFIALNDKAFDRLKLIYYVDQSYPVNDPYIPADGLVGHVVKTAVPLLASKAEIKLLISEGSVKKIGKLPVSWLGVPLIKDDVCIGVMGVQSYTRTSIYTHHDSDVIEFMANQISTVISRKEAHDKDRANIARLKLINELGLELGRIKRLEEIFSITEKHLSAYLDMNGLIISSINYDEQLVNIEYANINGCVIDTSTLSETRNDLKQNHAIQQVLTELKPFAVMLSLKTRKIDLKPDALVHQIEQSARKTQDKQIVFGIINSSIYIPIFVWKKIYGVLQLHSSRQNAYSQDDAALLEGMANVIGIAIRNSLLYKTLGDELCHRIEVEKELTNYRDHLELLVKRKTDELQEKQAQLAHSERLAFLGEMATGIAHELNQPLAIIHMQTELSNMYAAKGIPVSVDDAKEAYEQILSQTKRASQIIEHLRDFARTERGYPESLDLNIVIRSGLLFFTEQFKRNEIKLITEFDGALPSINFNSQNLEQIIVNLLTNAKWAVLNKSYTEQDDEDKKTIWVRTGFNATDNTCFIEVEDNGIGMTKTEQERCFEPFYTKKQIGEGAGLGLSIVFGIVKASAGKISIKSRKGSGTKIEVILKAEAQQLLHEPELSGATDANGSYAT